MKDKLDKLNDKLEQALEEFREMLAPEGDKIVQENYDVQTAFILMHGMVCNLFMTFKNEIVDYLDQE